jgi:hypothetical protein
LPQPNQYRAEDGYYSFTTRQSRSDSATIALAAGFNGFSFPRELTFPLAADQALKLVSFDARVSIINTAGATILNSLILVAENVQGAGTLARFYSPPWSNVPLGFQGVALHVEDPEWFFWNDYIEQQGSGLVPNVSLSLQGDFNGTGAADSISVQIQAVVEIYEKQKLGLGGQDRTLRTLREIPE